MWKQEEMIRSLLLIDGLGWGKRLGGGLVEFEADFSIGCGRE